MSSKFEKSRGLMIFEMIVYAAILVWFLKAFLPLGLQ